MNNKTLGFIGAGNMAAALVKGLLHAKVVPPEGIIVSDVKPERLAQLKEEHGIRTTQDNHELVNVSDVVVLSVKPQVIDKVLTLIGGDVKSTQLVISVAAGVPVSALESRLPEGTHVVRTMPNTPATVMAGATAIAPGTHATEEDLEVARALFTAVGRVVTLDESLLDAVTGLSGSGPAYIMLMIEAMADGGVKVGLHRDTALLLAAQNGHGIGDFQGNDPGKFVGSWAGDRVAFIGDFATENDRVGWDEDKDEDACPTYFDALDDRRGWVDISPAVRDLIEANGIRSFERYNAEEDCYRVAAPRRIGVLAVLATHRKRSRSARRLSA